MNQRVLTSVLLIACLIGWSHTYRRIEMYTHIDTLYREGLDRFWGHIALVGETINIACRMDNANQDMWKGQTKVVNSSRVTVLRDDPIVRATIRNVTKGDGGSYRCVGSDINLRVTDICSDNPPVITKCTCGMYNASIVCSFFTNTKVADTVSWTINYQPIGECGPENRTTNCTNTQLCDQFFLGNDAGYIVPSCVLDQTLSGSPADIQFNISGTNPFVSFYELLNHSLNMEPVTDEVANWMNQSLFATTPRSFYNSKQKLFFLPPSKRYQHTDYNDSSRSYIGYVAKLNDNITWTCEKMKEFFGNPLYSVSDGKDPRIIQKKNDEWMNTTIVHASFEDTKKYHCGDDTRWLIVIDAEKPPKVNQHSCLLDETRGRGEMRCTFATNSLLRDHMLWTPTYSISSGSPGSKQLERCGKSFCTDISCHSVTRRFNSDGLDELTCLLKGAAYGKVYDFKLHAENPFINTTLVISQPTDYKIVKMAAPTAQVQSLTYNSSVLSISCPVRDNSTDLINFKVTSPLFRDLIFPYKNASALVPLENLQSYTNYTLNIYCQFTETSNPDVWSEPHTFTLHTEENIPEVGPEVADMSYYIGESTDECAPPKRAITLIWKAIPEKSGAANGRIKSYHIYSYPSHTNSMPSRMIHKVPGDKTSQAMCINAKETNFAITGATAVGQGKKFSKLKVLASDRVIDMKSCHLRAELRVKPERVELNWDTFPNRHSYQFVVFWCLPDSVGGCLTGKLNWKAVGRATGWTINGSLSEYKFGVEVHDSHEDYSSGIVWVQCLSYPDKELRVADIQVNVDGLKVKVILIETCQKTSRAASSYTVQFCPYDNESNRCTAEVTERHLLPCDQSIEMKLDQFSTDYSFWLVSLAGSLQATSNAKVIRTTNNPFPMSGIVGLSAFVLVATVALTALSVWFHRQKRLARALKRPQLVKPFQLSLESEIYVDEDAGEDIDIYSPAEIDDQLDIVEVDSDEGSVCKSATSDEKLVANEYATAGNHQPNLDTCHSNLQDYQKPHLQFPSFKDYQKRWTELNSCSSSAELPDDYLKYTSTASELNLSTQLFYSDTPSTGGVIDLAKFVLDSGPTSTPPDYKDATMEYIKLESCNPEQDFSDGDEHFDGNPDEHDGFFCETDYTDLSSPDCSGGLTLSLEEQRNLNSG